MADNLSDERQWLRRAALLVNRESDLRRQIGVILLGGVVLMPALNALDYGLSLGVVLEGIGIGLFAGLMLVFLTINNRMESVFPEYGDDDDEETEDADDSLRGPRRDRPRDVQTPTRRETARATGWRRGVCGGDPQSAVRSRRAERVGVP